MLGAEDIGELRGRLDTILKWHDARVRPDQWPFPRWFEQYLFATVTLESAVHAVGRIG